MITVLLQEKTAGKEVKPGFSDLVQPSQEAECRGFAIVQT